jgi:methanogen homocitrate synthase
MSAEANVWVNDNWWGSEYNWSDEVRSLFELPGDVKFHDATLRDGEQSPGVVFRKEAKVEIAKLIDSVGIDRIEAGMPTVTEEDFEAIKEIANLGLNASIMLFCRAHPDDIEKAMETGASGLILEVPSGYPRIKNQFPQWSYDDVKKKAIDSIVYAKKKGFFVTFFPYDTTRAEENYLKSLMTEVVDNAKPDSVAIVDTIGCALPQAIYYMVKKVRSWVNVPVEIHTHNDFGMGVATSLAAVQAGAKVVHGCLTGLGERTGNTALEQVLVGLQAVMDMELPRIKNKLLYDVCRRISELSKIPIPVNAPVTGDAAFAREIGLGTKLFKTAPTTLFPVSPSFLGRDPRLVLGKKSGKDSVNIKLQMLGLTVREDKIVAILQEVKKRSTEKGTYLNDDEFKGILDDLDALE